MFKQEDLAELQKEKYKETLKPKKLEEWKPTTPEEYETQKDIEERTKAKYRAKTKDKTDRYTEDLKRYQRGETTEQELQIEYPQNRKAIEDFATSLRRSGTMQEPIAKKFVQKAKPWYVIKRTKVNEETLQEFDRIKTNEDLINIFNNRETLEGQGIDVKAIADYYKDEYLELARQGLLKK